MDIKRRRVGQLAKFGMPRIDEDCLVGCMVVLVGGELIEVGL